MASKRGVINLAKFMGKAACPEASFMQAAVQYSTDGALATYKLPELPYSYSALGALKATFTASRKLTYMQIMHQTQ